MNLLALLSIHFQQEKLPTVRQLLINEFCGAVEMTAHKAVLLLAIVEIIHGKWT